MKLFTIKNKSLEAMFFIQMKNSTLRLAINERFHVCLWWFVYYGKSLSLKSKHDATVFHRQDLCDAPDNRVQNGPIFKLTPADGLLFAARAGSEREDWSASVTIISDATHSKIFGRVQSGANIVNILIVTLNLTILDETWEEIKYGTKSKRVAFVTVSHIFANLA